MQAVKQAEDTIGGLFKDAPPLSNNAKESLVKAWPWIALIGGILQLLAAWWLYDLIRVADNVISYVNNLSVTLTGQNAGPTGFDKTLIYIGILMLAVEGVVLLMAYPQLKTRSRRGWELLFLGALLNVVYAVVALFIHGRGLGGFVMSLVESAIAFYLLFQVRDKFGGAAAKATTKKAAKSPVKKS